MKKYILCVIFSFLYLFFGQSSIVAQDTAPYRGPHRINIQDTNENEDELTTSGSQIIVKYHDEFNPDYLQNVVKKRAEQRNSLFGSIFLFIQNVRTSLLGNQSPEVHLSRIQSVDSNVAPVSKTALSSDPSSLQYGLYLITLEPESSIDEVITLYEALPEVEYAQPNNTYYYDFE